MPKKLRYWKLDGDFALIRMPNGYEYDVYLKATTPWLIHLRDKSWATQPVLNELRAILKARGGNTQEAKVS